MWTSRRRSGATHRPQTRRLGVVIPLLACAGLSACTGAADEAPPTATTTEAPQATLLPDTGTLEPLEAGTYLVTNFTVPFEITVPDGWESFGWGVLKADASAWQVFVNFLPPTSVPTDACEWQGTLTEFDPTPAAFAAAMAAQTSTATTPPVEITMDGYSGVEIDYSIESDVDIPSCDMERICLYADSGMSVCTRTYERLAERETERILDLNGEIALIAVGQFVDVDPALTQEARAVFDSITFSPDQ